MPRSARRISSTGIYHVMLRGADRRIIFADDQDRAYFIKILSRIKSLSPFSLYAYCLMGNHVHLLIRENDVPVSLILKRIGVSYVYYYNKKYDLHGHLFQDRFRSEAVETESYFYDCLRYICQNPVKAGICKAPDEYEWLGCSGVFGKKQILDRIQLLVRMNRHQVKDFINEPVRAAHTIDYPYKRLTDNEAIKRICSLCDCRHVQEIGGWEEKRRDEAITKALRAGVSIRQLSRLTSIRRRQIENVINS